jgi:WD40 repeat protein
VLHRSRSQELKFDPSGKRLAVTYVNGSLGLWDVASGELIKIADAKAAELYSVDWSPDGKLIATSGLHGSVCLWNAENLELIHEIESPEWVIFVRFNREGTRLIFGGGAEAPGGERSVRIFAVPE